MWREEAPREIGRSQPFDPRTSPSERGPWPGSHDLAEPTCLRIIHPAGTRRPIVHTGCLITMTPIDRSRRSFLKTSVALAGTPPLIAGPLPARADEAGGPLLAYVGTFSSPLRDVLP